MSKSTTTKNQAQAATLLAMRPDHQVPTPEIVDFDVLLATVAEAKKIGQVLVYGAAQALVTRLERPTGDEKGLAKVFFINPKDGQEAFEIFSARVLCTGKDNSRIWFTEKGWAVNPKAIASQYRAAKPKAEPKAEPVAKPKEQTPEEAAAMPAAGAGAI